ncbi:MAG: amidohydrolase family protein [Saprospiraceae bacterium]
MRFLIFATVLQFCFAHFCAAQTTTPAPPQQQPIIIKNATIHVGDGQLIPSGTIIFDKGKITHVLATTQALPNMSNAKVIDATGKHVYPGLIAPVTSLGLVEIEAVRATRDLQEVGTFNTNVRSLIAYNAESVVIPTVRNNGVLLAQIAPQGAVISGQSSIVQLDAWNWEDAAYKTDDGVFLDFPNQYQYTGWWAEPGTTKKNDGYNETLNNIKSFFVEAQTYAKSTSAPTSKNLKLEAMRGLFDGSKNLYIRVNSAQEIMSAVLFGKAYGITPVIVGGYDSWLVADFLKENNVPVILGATQNLPSREGDDIDQPFKIAAALQQAGVLYCFSNDDRSWQLRNLAFQAGQAVPFGITKEEALTGLTLSAAKILKIADRVGSLQVGKDATLFICSGDVLDMRTHHISQVFIQGRMAEMDDKQQVLYRRYNEKYNKK